MRLIIRSIMLVLLSIVAILLIVWYMQSTTKEEIIELVPFGEDTVVLNEEEIVSAVVNKGEVQDSGSSKNSEKIDGENMDNESVFVPSVGIYNNIREDGNFGELTESGSLILPENIIDAVRMKITANYNDSEGNLILAAHRSYYSDYGAFSMLPNLKKGDVAFIKSPTGELEKFKAISMDRYHKSQLPQEMFLNVNDGNKYLYLITCGGELIESGSNLFDYDSNDVAVFIKV